MTESDVDVLADNWVIYGRLGVLATERTPDGYQVMNAQYYINTKL